MFVIIISAADFETGANRNCYRHTGRTDSQIRTRNHRESDENKLDRDEAIKQGGTPGVGSQIFSVVSSLLLILGGFLLIIL